MWSWLYWDGSLIWEGMVDSLNRGRSQSARSIMFGVGMVVSGFFVDWILSRTNWVIWGQTRGVLMLHMIMPILVGCCPWLVMSVLRSVCGFDEWMKMEKLLGWLDVWK